MKMSLTIEGLKADVDTVAELGNEAVADVAERIVSVLMRSASSRILDLLSQVAAEVSDQLPDGHVEVRLAGDEVELAYIDDHRPGLDGGEAELSARITLRLPDNLKSRVEEAAARQGASVNGWILRVLERGVSSAPSASGTRPGRPGRRLHGYGTS